MSIVRVFHDERFMANYMGMDDPSPEHLKFAAEVITGDLEHAFHSTNNTDRHWIYHQGVRASGLSRRSTSVGDLMELNGTFYVVAPLGFRKVRDSKHYSQLLASAVGAFSISKVRGLTLEVYCD